MGKYKLLKTNKLIDLKLEETHKPPPKQNFFLVISNSFMMCSHLNC